MYIGPWQEFHLGRAAHQSTHKEADKNKLLHQNLITILENSLDPEVARQAIAAINPYLKDVSNTTNEQHNGISLPKVQQRNDHKTKSYRNIKRNNHPPRHNTRGLPLILSARNNYGSDGPPSNRSNRSTMSTKSEPIQGTRYDYTPEKVISREDIINVEITRNGNKDSTSYDTANVLDILKLERNAKINSNNHSIKRSSDLSSFWKWKKEGKPIPPSIQVQSSHGNGLSNDTNENNKIKKKDIQIQSKTDRVNKLKEIYSNKEQSNTNSSLQVQVTTSTTSYQSFSKDSSNSKVGSSSDTPNINLSPIRSRPSYTKPNTPIVKDKEITETDINAISKYFRNNPQDYNTILSQRQHHQQQGQASGRQSREMKRYDSHDLRRIPSPSMNRRDDMSISLQANTEDVLLTSNDNDDYLNGDIMTAEEGLLDWCTKLNTSDIDSLY